MSEELVSLTEFKEQIANRVAIPLYNVIKTSQNKQFLYALSFKGVVKTPDELNGKIIYCEVAL